jgi:hypothetical protein
LHQPGIDTALVTWMTPLDCITLAWVTVDMPPRASISTMLFPGHARGEGAALNGGEAGAAAAGADAGHEIGRGQPSGDDMVGQHRL